MIAETDDPKFSRADASEDLVLIRQIQSADSLDEACRARNALIDRHLKLVTKAVRRAVPRHLQSHHDDACQEACCALIEVAGSFVPDCGGSFVAVAMVAMRRRIYRYLNCNRYAVGGEWFGRNLGKVRRFIAQTGRSIDELSNVEIANGAGLPLLTVQRLRPWLYPSLHFGFNTTDTHSRSRGGEWVSDGETLISDAVEWDDSVHQLRQMVRALKPKDQRLLTRAFGLDGREPVTVAEASASLGLNAQAGLMRIRRAIVALRRDWPE
jgi:RNA polymerase sigma factor (sigma-70 family)